MKNLKMCIVYFLALLVVTVGIFNVTAFINSDIGNPITYTISALGFMIVFAPALEYWLSLFKKLLNINQND